MNCPYCGSAATAIEGMVHVIEGERVQEFLCDGGHRFGLKHMAKRGPCPSCGHVWAETARGGTDPDREPLTAPEAVYGSNLSQIADQAGLGGCMRYES